MSHRWATVAAAISVLSISWGCSGGGHGDACVASCTGKACGNDGCGGTCGSCPGAEVCGANGQCSAGGGDGGGNCGTGQTACGNACCSSSQSCQGSMCVELCTPVCPSGWQCNTSSPAGCSTHNPPDCSCTPQLVSCNGTQCQVGQTCQAGTCSCSAATICDSSTTPACATQTYVDDTCFKFGMNCNPTTGQCVLPADMDHCSPLTGCVGFDAGLDCIDMYTTQDSTGGMVPAYRCSRKCNSITDCVTPFTSCYTTVPQGFDPPVMDHCSWNPCTTPYTTCAGIAANSGTCIPISPDDWEDRSTGSAGINFPYVLELSACFENGTANANGNCNPSAGRQVDGGLSGLCPSGAVCVAIDANDGYCATLCNSCPSGVDGGFGTPAVPCAAGSSCYSLAEYNVFDIVCQKPSGAATCASGASCDVPGYCSPNCDIFGAAGQCSANASGTNFTCQTVFTYDGLTTTNGTCTATLPDAGATGSVCDQTTTNFWTCTNGNYCTNVFANAGPGAGTCEPYCNLAASDAGCPASTKCGSITSNCTTCNGGICLSLGGCAPEVVGFCQ
jgi:hypothetical protein